MCYAYTAHSQGWECVSVASIGWDGEREVSGELEQQGEKRRASVAGLQWPAWSSAGPAPKKPTHGAH